MICPDCMGTLAATSPVLAKCTTHGGIYRILFERPPAEAAAAPAVAAAEDPAGTLACPRHPDVATTLRCRRCRSGVCATCAFPETGGTVLCPDCASGRVLGLAARSPARAAAARCPRHPEVEAVERCSTCQSPVCATCDFSFEGDLHFCPNCATSSASDEVSSRRKRLALISYALGLLAMVSFVAMFVFIAVSDTDKDRESIGAVFGTVTMLASVVGVGLGLGAIDRRLSNPWWLRGAGALNGLLLGLFVALSIFGMMSG
jgi:hypothetical protein